MDVDESELQRMQQNESVDCCQPEPPPSSSNHKRQHENGDNQSESKRQRSQTPEQPTKIINVNDDCLEKIFEPLDLHELFNVAVANEWLRPAANNIYKRKFGMKKVSIGDWYGSETIYFDFEGSITVRGLRTSLQFLRCLGASIGNLLIYYDRWSDNQCKFIHQYIGKYCAESLIQIEFDNKAKRISIDWLENPFPNVHTVRIFRGDLGSQLSSLAKWFPNARKLNLDYVRIDKPYIDAPFHHLQVLRIVFDEYSSYLNAEELIAYFNNASLVKLDLDGYSIANEDAIKLTQELTSLKKLRFRLDNPSQYNQFVAKLDNGWLADKRFYSEYDDYWWVITVKRK